jgi:hypothetical protein
MKKLRRITEAEVIAEFLQGEFFHKEYDADREQFAGIVNHPDLANETENALRRALLFRRRDTMWWELPDDRQWWELEFDPADIGLVNVFPRAQWRKIADGNFKALNVAARIRQLKETEPTAFIAKIADICSNLQTDWPKGMIILLGIDEYHPLTLLEGNHRFIASLLVNGPNRLPNARFVGAFSPNMEECCWYKTNALTLARCLKNRIKHYWDRDPDVASLLKQARSRGVGGYAKNTGRIKSKIISN